MDYNDYIYDTSKLIGKMPGVGRRSALKMVLHLLKDKKRIDELVKSLQDLHKNVYKCKFCGNFDLGEVCKICTDETRDKSVLCIVEEIGDLYSLEQTRAFKGIYHILGGSISPADGIMPENLSIPRLIERIQTNTTLKEIIFANNKDLKSQTTIFYIMDLIKGLDCAQNLYISELAHGVPLGSGLDYLDEGTLTLAIKGRLSVDLK
jgi:recombination protein RecR